MLYTGFIFILTYKYNVVGSIKNVSFPVRVYSVEKACFAGARATRRRARVSRDSQQVIC